MSAIKGVYTQLQTYKEKPYVTLHIEFPEEMADEIIRTIGWPKKGESTWLAVALLKPEAMEPQFGPSLKLSENPKAFVVEKVKKSFGDLPLSNQAGMLCENARFQVYLLQDHEPPDTEGVTMGAEWAATCLREMCGIKSRIELDTNDMAAEAFREIVSDYEAWKLKSMYKDNLDF